MGAPSATVRRKPGGAGSAPLPMRSSARLAIALALFVVLAAAIGAGAHRAWQSLKADLGIHDLQWSQLRLGWKSIRLGELEFLAATDAGNFTLEARQLELTLERLLPAPRLGRLGIETLQVRQQRSAAPGMAEDTSLPDIDVLVQDLVHWLPLQVAIERFQLALPCPTGLCEEQGGIRLEHSGNLPASAQLDRRRPEWRRTPPCRISTSWCRTWCTGCRCR